MSNLEVPIVSSELPSPLAGIRVLDLSRVLSGPYVGRMMADLGADVVKVEPPSGDLTRNWGRLQAGMRGYYLQWNLGKRGVCVDLTRTGGAELVRDLACKADVLVENFRPHVMERFGLDYESLSRLHPALVMASITGFGSNSPQGHRGAFAPVIHAESGLIARQAKASEAGYFDIETSFADTASALHTLVAVLSALVLRNATGKGQHVDMSMIDAQVATDDIGVYEIEDSLSTRPTGNRVWETKDGPVLIAADSRYLWRLLSSEEGLIDRTPKDADLEQKIRNRRRVIGDFLRSLPSRAAFIDLMDKHNIHWGDVRDRNPIGESEAISHRGMVTQVTDHLGGTRPALKSPYKFSAARSEIRGYAPHLGEHNRQVLKDWLDMDDSAIQALEDSGTLIQASR